MEFLGSVARGCLVLIGLYVIVLIMSEWTGTGRPDLTVAWVVWTSPFLRVASLASLGLVFIDLVLIGRR
jgi:hypothetical protein